MRFLFSLTLLVLSLSFLTAASVDYFLKIEGIPGESRSHSSHQNEIDLLYYNNSVITAREAGSGLATGRRQYQPLLVRKRIDKSSPLLMKAVHEQQQADGTVRRIPTATLSVCRSGGNQFCFYTITFEGVRVLDINQDGNEFAVTPGGSDDFPLESVSFSYQKITWSYIEAPGTRPIVYSIAIDEPGVH